MQFGASRRITSPSGQGSQREPAAPAATDIVVTSQQGDHSDTLFRSAIQGDDLGVVEIRLVKGGKAYLKIRLHHSMIASFSVSGSGGDAHDKPIESWTLNGDKIEYETDQAGAAHLPADRPRASRA